MEHVWQFNYEGIQYIVSCVIETDQTKIFFVNQSNNKLEELGDEHSLNEN
jgi:hypothetical protein